MVRVVRLPLPIPGESIGQAIRVLLVDDHPLARGGLHRLLDMEPDIELVGEATNGEEALSKVQSLSPDVILMDIRMPTMNGLEATRLLKGRGLGGKVIVLSFIDKYLAQAIEAGASGYLTKDVDGDELVDAIRRVHRGELVLGRGLMSNPKVGEDMVKRFQEMASEQVAIQYLGADDLSNFAGPNRSFNIVPVAEGQRDGAEGGTWVSQPPHGTTTLLFSDIQDSTALPEQLGDYRAQKILHAHNAIVREQISSYEGFEVKTMGDGFMVAFSSARSGLLCSIGIQRMLFSYNYEHADQPVRVGIGLHTGETIREANDFYGKNVILAHRISEQAKGGQILVSSLLKELTESAGDIRFGEARQVQLKGFDGTHWMYSVHWKLNGT